MIENTTAPYYVAANIAPILHRHACNAHRYTRLNMQYCRAIVTVDGEARSTGAADRQILADLKCALSQRDRAGHAEINHVAGTRIGNGVAQRTSRTIIG